MATRYYIGPNKKADRPLKTSISERFAIAIGVGGFAAMFGAAMYRSLTSTTLPDTVHTIAFTEHGQVLYTTSIAAAWLDWSLPIGGCLFAGATFFMLISRRLRCRSDS